MSATPTPVVPTAALGTVTLRAASARRPAVLPAVTLWAASARRPVFRTASAPGTAAAPPRPVRAGREAPPVHDQREFPPMATFSDPALAGGSNIRFFSRRRKFGQGASSHGPPAGYLGLARSAGSPRNIAMGDGKIRTRR